MCVLSKYCPHLDPKHVGIFFFVFFYSVYFICLCGFSQKRWIYIINLILEVIEKALLVIQSFQISLANWWNMTFVLFFKLKFLILVQKTWIQHIFFFTSCFFMQKNFVFNSDETKNLRSIFVSSLLCRQRCRRRISEPCQTSKVERFAKIVNN